MSNIGNPTFSYLGVSENSKVRHVLDFFKGFPRIIRVENSRMANPYHVITWLAGTLEAGAKRKALRNRFVIGFLFWTGVRVNEMLLTRKDDLDLITRTYNVPTLKQRRRAYRPIPLNHVPVAELKLWARYMETVEGEGIVVVSDRQAERIVKKQLGGEYTPHTLRHGLGLWLYEYTKDIRVVAQVLRHTNIANTLIYTRLSLDAIREKLTIA